MNPSLAAAIDGEMGLYCVHFVARTLPLLIFQIPAETVLFQ